MSGRARGRPRGAEETFTATGCVTTKRARTRSTTLLQELDTVTGLIEKNGALAEADVYDGYGKVRIWDYSPGDFDRDGDVDATDQTTFNAALIAGGSNKSTPDPMSDLDGDGDTDLTDAGLFTTIKNAGGALAERFVSSLGNPFFFTGRRLYMLESRHDTSATLTANQQLQHNRARHYSPLEGRWLQRDPAGYVDGLNLYEYCSANPSIGLDPKGEQGCGPWKSEKVFSDYEKIILDGQFMRNRLDPERKWIDYVNCRLVPVEIKGMEIDFQIAFSRALKIVLIGADDDSEIEIPFVEPGFRWPTIPEIFGGLDDEGKRIDISGILCRKKEFCVRQCRRTCCCAQPNGAYTFTDDRMWLHGSTSQYWYGKVAQSGAGASCQLFGPGQRFRVGGWRDQNPSSHLACGGGSVPLCPK
ncbi:MAG: RHS repeat-associated core domain-containing protein [Phycisphaerales bacterium]|nr:RHS repeat-associated core domain-containing protein [Phycisphaerales bacterium]